MGSPSTERRCPPAGQPRSRCTPLAAESLLKNLWKVVWSSSSERPA
jgi:hypothetical protein